MKHQIAERFSLDRIAEAHELMESGTAIDKIIIELSEGFDPETDSKEQILADLKESFRQAESGQALPLSELWKWQ